MKAPLEMPASGAALQAFEPQRIDYAAPEAGGRVGGVQAGFPLWMATWSLGRIGEDTSDEWRSFMLELRGAIRTFYGRDLRRPYPKAHIRGFSRMTKVGGTPFTGAASSWSESINADGDSLVTLNGLAPGLILGTGDYVGFRWDATGEGAGNMRRRAMVRVVRGGGGMANASGTVIVRSEPPIPACVPGSAIAHLDRPACVMKQLTAESKLDPIDRRGAVRGGTLVAIQDLRA